MSTTTATQEQKQAALHAATLARLAYWDAMEVLEKMYAPDGDIGDKQSDKLHDLVVNLAAGYPGSVVTPRPEVISTEHIAQLDQIFA